MREPAVRDHYYSDLQHEVRETEQDKELSSYLTAVIEEYLLPFHSICLALRNNEDCNSYQIFLVVVGDGFF